MVGASVSRRIRSRSGWDKGPSDSRRHRVGAGTEGVEPRRQVRLHASEQARAHASAGPALEKLGRAHPMGLVPALAAPHHHRPLLRNPVGEPAQSVGVHGGAPDQQPTRSGVQWIWVALRVPFRRSRGAGNLPLDAVALVGSERSPEVEEIAELAPAVGFDKSLVVFRQPGTDYGLDGDPVPMGVHGRGRRRHESDQPVAVRRAGLRIGHGGSIGIPRR